MNNQTILVAIIALLLGVIGGYAFSRFDEVNDLYPHCGGVVYGDDYKKVSPMSGEGHMDHSVMMVSSEREFIEGMIPHHEEAIDTANEVIARGGINPEVRALVENIVVAQEAEVSDMKRWYQDWYSEPYQDTGTYQPMMRELEGLSGAALDQVFLTDMIMHHMGAIMMASSVQPYIQHQEMANLTNTIVETQSDEIVLMRQLLQEY